MADKIDFRHVNHEFIILFTMCHLIRKGFFGEMRGQLLKGLSYLSHVSPAKSADKDPTYGKLGGRHVLLFFFFFDGQQVAEMKRPSFSEWAC